MLSNIERELISEDSQALPVCPSGKSIVMMKVSHGAQMNSVRTAQ
jgi:hypothetical protein